MTPTAAMEVLLGLPPLHVMIEVEVQAHNSGDPNPLILVMPKTLGIWSTDPFSRWCLTR